MEKMTDYKRETFKQKIIMLNLPIGFKSVILIISTQNLKYKYRNLNSI
jgi:hypothetical protein